MRILVAIDHSEPSHRALRTAMALATRTQGRLLLVHAMAPGAAPGLDPAHPEPLRRWNATKRLDPGTAIPLGWAAELDAADVAAEVVARPGLPAEVVMEEARRTEADLIVMGTHERRGVERFFLGSVAQRVVRESEVPVLVVPPHGKAPWRVPGRAASRRGSAASAGAAPAPPSRARTSAARTSAAQSARRGARSKPSGRSKAPARTARKAGGRPTTARRPAGSTRTTRRTSETRRARGMDVGPAGARPSPKQATNGGAGRAGGRSGGRGGGRRRQG